MSLIYFLRHNQYTITIINKFSSTFDCIKKLMYLLVSVKVKYMFNLEQWDCKFILCVLQVLYQLILRVGTAMIK